MKNLKLLRKNKNYTLQELAEELSMSAQVLSRYEREERQADYNTLIKIANFFDVSIDYLLGESTYYHPDKVKELKNAELKPDELKLLNTYRNLPSALKSKMLGYIDGMNQNPTIQINKNA